MATPRRRANYALLDVQEHLGPDADGLEVPWAEFVGNRTSEYQFSVPTPDPADAYYAVQVFDVGEYGHELVVNGEPMTGFDVPPSSGWQYWMDTITGASLREGENVVCVRRDATTDDSFVVGTLTVHWREPVEGL